MAFDIEKAKRQSETLEGAVADFRKACSEASVRTVEGARIAPGAGGWGLEGDLAEMTRVMRLSPATHVFLAVERYDLDREVAAAAEALGGAGVRVDSAGLARAASDLRGLNGLAVKVNAAASFAGVPFAGGQEAAWRGEAVRRLRAAVDSLDPGGASHGRPATGNGAGDGDRDPKAGGAEAARDAARGAGPRAPGAPTQARSDQAPKDAAGAKPRGKIFGFGRG